MVTIEDENDNTPMFVNQPYHTGNDGIGYSVSSLKAILAEGESYTVDNWRGSGVAMKVYVKEIKLNSNPGYADVIMTFGTTKAPTNNPTRIPTRHPTDLPTLLPTNKPTNAVVWGKCGNSVCDNDEGSSSCPADCAGKQLETTFAFTLGSKGNMFQVEALRRDISISSIIINSMSRGVGAVKVYTRSGSYGGHEQNSDGWTLIYDNPSLTHNRRGQPTELGDFNSAVNVNSGTVQSFLVTSSKGVVYKAGTEEGAPFVSDDSMVIYEGIGTTDVFSGVTYSPRVFGGRLK